MALRDAETRLADYSQAPVRFVSILVFHGYLFCFRLAPNPPSGVDDVGPQAALDMDTAQLSLA